MFNKKYISLQKVCAFSVKILECIKCQDLDLTEFSSVLIIWAELLRPLAFQALCGKILLT
jgi:hypothetical protein